MKSEIRNGTFTEITKAEIKNGTFTEITEAEIKNGTFTEITKAEIKNGTFTEIVICRVFLGNRNPALGFATKNPITFFIEIWSPQGPFASVPYTRSGGISDIGYR